MTDLMNCRGYISSRPFGESWAPQHIQNTVIRDYCVKNGFHYLLSAAEYAVPKCYMVLEEVLEESKSLYGIVLYSIHQLPENESHRKSLCEKFLNNGCIISSSVEGIVIKNTDDLFNANTILNLDKVLPDCINHLEY